MYLSSRSPPDHLLYQMLKTVPVWAGIAPPLKVAGSTCARAGRRFFLVDFLGFVTAVDESTSWPSPVGEAHMSSVGGAFESSIVVSSVLGTSASIAAAVSTGGTISEGDSSRGASSEVSMNVGGISSVISGRGRGRIFASEQI